MIVRITDLVTQNNRDNPDAGPTVKIYGRDENNERYTVDVDGTFPYFYVSEDIQVRHSDNMNIVHIEDGYRGYDGKSLQKIMMKQPMHVGSFGDEFEETYEADINYSQRLAVDEDLSGYIRVPDGSAYGTVHIQQIETDVEPDETIDPRIMFCDIETVPPSGGMDFNEYINRAEDEILCFTTYDSYDEEYLAAIVDPDNQVDAHEIRSYLEDHWGDNDYQDNNIRFSRCVSEKDLLNKFVDEVYDKRPDILSGWNFTDFDMQYILNRCSRYGQDEVYENDLSDNGYVQHWMDASGAVQGLPSFDMMEMFCGFMSYSNWESWSLDYVSEEELEAGKVEDINIMTEYHDNRTRFMAYNIVDVELTVLLDDKNGIHEFALELSNTCSVNLTDIL